MKIAFVTDIFATVKGNEGKTDSLPPGSAQWSFGFAPEKKEAAPQTLLFICPCGCKRLRSVPVAGDRAWKWDGNLTVPTLTPSILIIGECGWHGFLTAGEWKTV